MLMTHVLCNNIKTLQKLKKYLTNTSNEVNGKLKFLHKKKHIFNTKTLQNDLQYAYSVTF